MCFECDDDEEGGLAPLRFTEELAWHARRIEEDLPGDPVSEEAWEIFFGLRGGSLVWADHERMARCREAALLMLSMSSLKPAPDAAAPATF